MKKQLLLIISTILLSLSFVGCGITRTDGLDSRSIFTFTFEGTADSVTYDDGGHGPKVIYKDEYPAERNYIYWHDQGDMLVTIQNISDTGYVYLTIYEEGITPIYEYTTYDTLASGEVWGY